jgi:hypothetical protein
MTVLVSELVRFDQFDQIIGFKIASCSYVTTEMEMEPTTEQIEHMELLKAIKEMMETQIGSLAVNVKSMQEDIKANQEERKAERKADREDLLERLEAKIEANQVKTDVNVREMRKKSNLAKQK